MNPPLKWVGGKRWQLEHIKPLWEPYKDTHRFVEPFCGGASISLGLAPKKAWLNDINPYLINFYQWLQYGLMCSIVMENNSECYYNQRDRFNELIKLYGVNSSDSQEMAALFYYLNRTGYNGLCRFNKKGGYNVPFGQHKTINYIQDLTEYKKYLSSWHFTCGDFEKVRFFCDEKDFIYADPPYDVEFKQYTKEGFTWQDQMKVAVNLSQSIGPVVLSNQATPRIINLYTELGYKLTYLDAPRRISCKGDRSTAKEVLATRNI